MNLTQDHSLPPWQQATITEASILESELPSEWEQCTTNRGRPYFVNHHNRITTWMDPRMSPKRRGHLPAGWELRSIAVGKFKCVDYNSRKTTWNDPGPSCTGDVAPLYVRNLKRVVEFVRKKPTMNVLPGLYEIWLRRSHLLEDSYAAVLGLNVDDLKKHLIIHIDSEVCDVRQWIAMLSSELFNPDYGLFFACNDSTKLQINPASDINPDHLSYFKFTGRLLGLSIIHDAPIDKHFENSLHRMILGSSVSLADLKSVDIDLHRRLSWILKNDITGVLDERFQFKKSQFGELITVDLKRGISGIDVTEQNKREYVEAMVQNRISGCVKEQFQSIKDGLVDIIPWDILKIFDEKELDMLIRRGINNCGCLKKVESVNIDEAVEQFWASFRSWSCNSRKFCRVPSYASSAPTDTFTILCRVS